MAGSEKSHGGRNAAEVTKADAGWGSLDRLIGAWMTEATHPALPGVVVHGTADIDWVEGRRFVVIRSRNDHPDFPDSIAVLGDMGTDRVEDTGNSATNKQSSWRMHYFDSRGVFRAYETRLSDDSWRWWRDAKGFSQRFTGDFTDGGDTIVGRSQLCEDDVHWTDDLALTYRRRKPV